MNSKQVRQLASARFQWVATIIITASLSIGATFLLSPQVSSLLRSQAESQALSSTQETAPKMKSVSALGRLEPKGEIVRLSAPNSLNGTSTKIQKLLVQQGDRVTKGQVVAILNSRDSWLAAAKRAKSEVQVAKAKLALVKSGAKKGDIHAQADRINRLSAELKGQVSVQRATIAGLEADLNNATVEYRRYQTLNAEGAVSDSEADSRRLRLAQAQEQLKEAKATLQRTIRTTQIQQNEARSTLDSIAEVRPAEVQVAEAELARAIAIAHQAEAELALTYVHAPINGQILKIHAWPGETIDRDGIADMGHTREMYVVAEVYETDIHKVRRHQTALITSPAFSGQLDGKVSDIGLQVERQETFSTNPLVQTDNKVIDVRIRLDPASSQKVSSFSNLQVQVVIQS
ncbi:ABC exporter membrane fusion protein [Acaryochloris sp. IP29b_bin.137]|uniref:ABC exporter membrane fusion protein n=1 Tax=Acaryochloris sp. IP29b_bin.137 TaxID=2969217 RepID=UPI00261A43C7|nr:ABC exporter membrane fusion protein [Acaryochloris sp. IP29b_bin.137]